MEFLPRGDQRRRETRRLQLDLYLIRLPRSPCRPEIIVFVVREDKEVVVVAMSTRFR